MDGFAVWSVPQRGTGPDRRAFSSHEQQGKDLAMRGGLLIAILAIAIVAIGAFYFVDVDQTQEGRMPDVDVSVEDPGQAPDYDVETGDVDVGTERKTIEVPDVDVTPAPAD
jgi:hypothetical protein